MNVTVGDIAEATGRLYEWASEWDDLNEHRLAYAYGLDRLLSYLEYEMPEPQSPDDWEWGYELSRELRWERDTEVRGLYFDLRRLDEV